MFGHQPLVVYLWVSECICASADMLPYCFAHDEWLTTKPHKYVRHNTANNVSTFSMSGAILPTMCQLLVCRVQYCQQCVNF